MLIHRVRQEAMNDILDVFEDTHPATLAISHVMTGAVLSPLELVRTRYFALYRDSSNHVIYFLD